MYKHILVPVDLAHQDALAPALRAAADLAGLYGAKITYAGVTSDAPGAVAHTPAEFAEKLAAFAAANGATAKALVVNDPRIDLDKALIDAVADVKADLVVMQSHSPGALEHIWPSNGGKLASHAACSVLLVRAKE